MAGDLIIDKVAKTSTATKTDLVRGLAKAWISFNGVNGTVLKSLNIASAVDTGNGTQTFNMTAPMDSASYAATIGVINTGVFAGYGSPDPIAANQCLAFSFNAGGTGAAVDCNRVMVEIQGDLA